MSFNLISSNKITEILPKVVDNFKKVLNTEINEKVLCHALEMFGLWSKRFSGELPASVGEIFKKGFELKTTTASVRLSYLQWFLACLKNASLSANINFTPVLMGIFEKALQNPNQIPALCEAACASCILLKTEKLASDDNNLASFWNNILDMNKQVFFTERFSQLAPPDTLCYLTLMAEMLLCDFYSKLKGQTQPIFKTIIHSLTSPLPKVRENAIELLPKIIKSNNGVSFIKQMIHELEAHIEVVKIHYDEDKPIEEGYTPCVAIVNAIRELTNVSVSCADAQDLALNILIVSHHPAVVHAAPNLWHNILTSFEVDAKVFISLNSKHLTNLLITDYKNNPSYENAIATIIRLSPDLMLPTLIEKVITYLKEADINVTDDEYFTFLTPEGELYDKSVIPNSDDLYSTTRLKRENKVYSYKEQLEEIQLRREIEEKRRKEGKAKPPVLTPKQKEVIQNQVEKEKSIRQRLKKSHDSLISLISMIKSACSGNAKAVSLHFYELLDAILRNLSSPLAAGPLTDLYFYLRTTCYSDKDTELGYLLAITTLRFCKPKCDLKEEWVSSNLDELTLETLTKLYNRTVEQLDDNGVMESEGCLTAPAFSYAFQFLRRALLANCITSKDELMIKGILIIERHAQLKGNSISGDITDYHHPKYMPRASLFEFLLSLITKYRARIQTQAVAALLEVAKSSSGQDYCTSARAEDISLLLNSLQSSLEANRDVSLRALTIMLNGVQEQKQTNPELKKLIVSRLWIAKFDESADNCALATELWDKLEMEMPQPDELLEYVIHNELCIQKAAAASLVPMLSPDKTKQFLKKLLSIYNEKLTMIPPKLDQFDREIEPAVDQWIPRRGIAIAISKIGNILSLDDVNHIMQFMVSQGLGDREEIVHKEMLAAALAIVEIHGKDTIVELLPVFETFLDKAPKSQSFDNIRQAVVILMGSLARHLDKEDKRIEPIVRRLISALSTPSEQVQEAVANCLPHLMPSVKEEAPAMVKRLLQQLVKSEKYGERRGAAYGIAGIVKGLGILSLKQFDIMSKLTTYIQEKKNYKSREGALFAFEILCSTLGRLFEPYIVHVLPHLLQCFGDSSQYVRQAADDTAKVVMGKLSAHGVKLVLPSLLDALDQDSWRTKTASVELLGAMAFCAPKQLSSCLPSIVPKLIEVLGDSHTKVQEAGADALKVIGSVIKNPEIQAIVPVLLKALEDPSKNTSVCLQSLLQTKFVHFIDAPSLALIMPVVQRAFMDRSTETRKMAGMYLILLWY